MMDTRVGGSLPDTLLVPLSGRTARASEAARRLLGSDEVVVFPLGQLTNGRDVLRQSYEFLALAGAPPTEELGFGFTPVVALLGQPKRVALIDLRNDTVESKTLIRYLIRSAPFAVGQIAGSALAVLAQRAAIPLVQRAPRVRPANRELRNVVYL